MTASQDDQVNLVVEVFRMLADATRVQVLWSLTDREMSVNELAEHVVKPAPSVSQHLAKLRMARCSCFVLLRCAATRVGQVSRHRTCRLDGAA
jgi:DNA-binding transcriptional ArsR family regulator